MSVLEKAAMAGRVADRDGWPFESTSDRYLAITRAILETIREATPEMIAAGHLHDPLGCDVVHAGDIYPPVFAAMIDAILAEGAK